jgi:serine/threonine protein kinase/Flp pilus assembly protein TadD
MSERSIFMEALEFDDPRERDAHILRACGGDERLRARVEALLRRHQSDDVLALDRVPAVDLSITADLPAAAEHPGTVIGPYKLLEQVGEGGMGIVFMAEQTQPIRRKVALKIIKPGMDTRQVIARFEAERQALALMDHPNIARVLDAGTTGSGRPYFVMELVRGIPITTYCDQAHLSIDDRLELFALVCRAVQHAHQKGIIHRDLKPTNVLITLHDGVPVPKIIDFGIAKATGQSLTDRTLYTGFAQLVGTPLYMSPEQAELSGLDVDTRSDIYSLGVLLYELLTGTTPFDQETMRKAALDEMRRIIREEEPPKPSTRLSALGDTLTTVSTNRKADPRHLGRTVRGELDWIVMKALEKDRRRRYETANDFAADVMRYLTDQPVEACPPSAWYRFGKFARRNRVTLTTAGLVGIALVAGTAVSAWQAVMANRARRDAIMALAEVDAQRREARRAVDAMYSRVAEKWLAEQPQMKALQREFLQEALRYYQEFARRRRLTPDELAEAATAYQRVGRIQSELGHTNEARAAYDQAIPLLRRLVDDRLDSAEFRRRLFDALRGHGSLAWKLRDWASAERLSREAMAHMRWLLERFPEVPEYASLLAQSQVDLGLVLTDAGRRDEADVEFRQAAARLRPLLNSRGGDLDLTQKLSQLDNNHALLLEAMGRLGDAEEALRESLRLLDSVVTAAPDRPNHRLGLAYRHVNLGNLLCMTGRFVDAEAEFHRAIGHLDRLIREFPDVPDYRHTLSKAYGGLGRAYIRSQRPLDAEAAFHREIVLDEGLVASFPEMVAYRGKLAADLNSLGLVLNGLGRYPEAETILRRAASLHEQIGNTRSLAIVCSSLGQVLRAMGRLDDAAMSFQRSRELWTKILADSKYPANAQHSLGGVLHNLARVNKDQGKLAEARQLFQEALARQRDALKDNPRDASPRLFLRNHYWGLGETLALLGDHQELARVVGEMRTALPESGQIPAIAAKCLIDVLPFVERDASLTSERRREVAESYAALIRELIDQAGRLGANDPEAQSLLARVLADAPDARFPDPARAIALARSATQRAPQDADGWTVLGLACYRTGALVEATDALKRAMELKSGGDPNQWLILALTAHARGDAAEARRLHGRSLEWLKNRPGADPELYRLRDEAARVLGVQAPPARAGHEPAKGVATKPR